MGTFNMLEAARTIQGLKKFLYVSTDEVFGASTTPHKEDDALTPSNPYSATKAAGEYLVRAWGRTFGVPYIITRTMNLFGRTTTCRKVYTVGPKPYTKRVSRRNPHRQTRQRGLSPLVARF